MLTELRSQGGEERGGLSRIAAWTRSHTHISFRLRPTSRCQDFTCQAVGKHLGGWVSRSAKLTTVNIQPLLVRQVSRQLLPKREIPNTR